MIALDTNVLARWILRDDAEQAEIAESVLSGPCWVGATVFLELGWVLLNSAKIVSRRGVRIANCVARYAFVAD